MQVAQRIQFVQQHCAILSDDANMYIYVHKCCVHKIYFKCNPSHERARQFAFNAVGGGGGGRAWLLVVPIALEQDDNRPGQVRVIARALWRGPRDEELKFV